MRQVVVAIALMLGALLPCRAFTVVDGEGKGIAGPATLVIDFSDATVEGLPLDGYLADVGEAADFKSEQREYYADFIKRFNDRCKSVMLTRAADMPLTLRVKVLTINRKGNEASCSYIFTAGDDLLLSVTERTREGRIGSFTNLVGDVIREAGGDFGSFLSKFLKKKSKQTKNTDPIYE